MAPIGERTLRWFLLFLVSCIVVAGFYDYENITFMVYMSGRIASSFWDRFVSIFETQPIVLAASLALTIIVIALVVFIALHIMHISRNVTTIENEIYIMKSKKQKIDTNFYDKGFIQNWMEVLFVK